MCGSEARIGIADAEHVVRESTNASGLLETYNRQPTD